MSFEKYLPKAKVDAKISGIMFRPSQEICDFLVEVGTKHKCSANKVVLAIIQESFEKYKAAKEELAAIDVSHNLQNEGNVQNE